MANNSSTGDKFRTALLVIIGFIVIILAGGCMSLYQRTLIDWWWPVGITALLALMSAAAMYPRWRRLTGTDSKILNFICHTVVSFTLILFAFFAVNYFFADDTTIHPEQVTVERKYREKRNRTRRVGRRSYTTGEVYYEYYMEIRFSNGRIKSVPVPRERYSRIRTGSTLTFHVEMGNLGVPVIKDKKTVTDE